MNKYIIILSVLFVSSLLAFQQKPALKVPDCVPDSLTAKAVAEIILVKYYGPNVKKRFPLQISEDNKKEVWILTGVLKERKGYVTMGGVPYIEIRKKDCCILKIIHGK